MRKNLLTKKSLSALLAVSTVALPMISSTCYASYETENMTILSEKVDETNTNDNSQEIKENNQNIEIDFDCGKNGSWVKKGLIAAGVGAAAIAAASIYFYKNGVFTSVNAPVKGTGTSANSTNSTSTNSTSTNSTSTNTTSTNSTSTNTTSWLDSAKNLFSKKSANATTSTNNTSMFAGLKNKVSNLFTSKPANATAPVKAPTNSTATDVAKVAGVGAAVSYILSWLL